VKSGTTYPKLTLLQIVANNGFVTDGDWVESKDQDPEGTIRLTQLADVGDGWFRDRSDRWMNDEQVTRIGVTYLQEGDVLIARMPDPLGRACVCPRLPTPAVTVVDVCIVRTTTHNPKWVMYALNAPQSRKTIASFEAGSTRKRISKGNLSTIPLPMPPRPAQDRIVAEIETQFTRLDAAVATLERVKLKLKRARASVLKAAVEGRLVPTEAALAREQGRSYEPATVLLTRVLAERKARWPKGKKYVEPVKPETEGLAELPEGWVWASLSQLSVVSGGATKNARFNDVGLKLPYLRVANVYANELRLDDVTELSVAEAEIARLLLVKGDILVVEGNGSIDQLGRAALWTGAIERCIHQNHIIKARPVFPALSRWALWWMLSPNGRREVERVASSTSGLHTLSISKVESLLVRLPPLAEQTRIVAEVDRRLSVLDALDTSVEHNLKKCARLRQSILKRAFEGKLVRQSAPDPLASATP
jgi:type I restriction enzyme S subunit